MKQHLLKKSLLATSITLVMYPSFVFADTNLSNSNKIISDTVVISASRTEQDLLDVNSSVAVVSQEQITTSGADNVPDLLKRESGVRLVSDGTPGAKRIAIRGESSSRTAILIDGQRSDDQKTKSGAPLLINPYFVERIEVVKGPASVLYGSDAIGGVVNVISKQAADRPFAFEGGLLFSSATNGFSEYANASGTVNNFKYVVGAFNTDQGDVYLADRKRLKNTSYGATGVNGDFSYTFADKYTVGYKGEYFVSDSETATTTSDKTYNKFIAEIPQWDRQKHSLYTKLVDLNEYIAAVEASIYYQDNKKDFRSKPIPGMNVGVYNEQTSIGGNVQAEFSLGDTFYLVTGYDYRREDLDSTSDIVIPYGAMRKMHLDDKNFKQNNHAVYALLSTYLTDELTLNTGVRYNYIKAEGGVSHIQGILHMPNGSRPINDNISYGDVSFTKTVGSAGLVYRPFTYGAFRLNWSQGFRAPNLQELYMFTSTGAPQFGNPDLKPEESNNFELGFRWENPNGLVADAAIFYTKADDYIETYNMSKGFFSYRNIAKATTKGAELSLSYLIANHYEPYINLTFLEREYKTNKGSTKNTGTPDLMGNVGLRYINDWLKLDGYASFANETKIDNFGGASYFDDAHFGGYVTYNLSASANFGNNDMFTVFASVENILDKSYQTNELIHEPGRFMTLGVRGQF